MAETVYILTGSNIGNREDFLSEALERMENIDGFEVVATSAVYVTQAQEMVGENPSFLNQAIMGEYMYLPQELLEALEKIERDLGRTQKGMRQPRTIDLDILLFGDQIVKTEKLTIPHREFLNRAFAMVPVLQIEPGLIHPVTKKPISSYVSDADKDEVILYKDHVARIVGT